MGFLPAQRHIITLPGPPWQTTAVASFNAVSIS